MKYGFIKNGWIEKMILFAAGCFVLTALLINPLKAEQCGPGCPACSGNAIGDLLPQKTISASWLYIHAGEEETDVYNLRYGLFSWMDVGLGYGRNADEMTWSIRVQPIAQNSNWWRPSLILGTGSIQTGGNDQSVYIQLAKKWEIVEDTFGLSITGGYATDIPDIQENWMLCTFTITIIDRINPFYIYDGINSHAGLSINTSDWLTLAIYTLEMEELAGMVSFQFGL